MQSEKPFGQLLAGMQNDTPVQDSNTVDVLQKTMRAAREKFAEEIRKNSKRDQLQTARTLHLRNQELAKIANESVPFTLECLQKCIIIYDSRQSTPKDKIQSLQYINCATSLRFNQGNAREFMDYIYQSFWFKNLLSMCKMRVDRFPMNDLKAITAIGNFVAVSDKFKEFLMLECSLFEELAKLLEKKQGLTSEIQAAQSTNDQELLRLLAWTFSNLCTYKLQNESADFNILQPAIELFKNTQDEEILCEVCWGLQAVLWNNIQFEVSTHNDKLVRQLLQVGYLDVALKAIQSTNVDIILPGLMLFLKLLHCAPNLQEEILTPIFSIFFERLRDLIQSQSQKIRVFALKVCHHLVEELGNPEFNKIILEQALPYILHVAIHDAPSARREALQILEHAMHIGERYFVTAFLDTAYGSLLAANTDVHGDSDCIYYALGIVNKLLHYLIVHQNLILLRSVTQHFEAHGLLAQIESCQMHAREEIYNRVGYISERLKMYENLDQIEEENENELRFRQQNLLHSSKRTAGDAQGTLNLDDEQEERKE